jgi:hypothetical protein
MDVGAPKKLAASVNAMRLGAPKRTEHEELAKYCTRVANAFRVDGGRNLSRRDVRRLPFVILDSPFRDDDELFASALRELKRRQRRSSVLGLIAQYLEQFDASNPRLRSVAAFLSSTVNQWDWIWADRSSKYSLFLIDRAPYQIANAALSSEVSPREVLGDAGLAEGAMTGGLGEDAFARACGLVSETAGLPCVDLQRRLMEWARGQRSFEYPAQWRPFFRALLNPWLEAKCPDAHRSALCAALMACAGDPRTAPNQNRWEVIRQNEATLYSLLVRWLTRASIFQFLDIVGQTALDHQWKYRRAFWTAYLEAGHISEAWVAFGSQPARYARRARERDKESDALAFAELETGTAKSRDHSALILRIGDLTIVDWSHNGKYQVWKRGDRGAPNLHAKGGYRLKYTAEELSCAPISGVHSNPPGYSWQNRLAEFIRTETGLRTSSVNWQPR